MISRRHLPGLLATCGLSVAVVSCCLVDTATAQSGSRNAIGGSTSRVQSGSGTRNPSGSGTSQYNGSATRVVQKTYETRFWEWMKSVQYRNWGPAPGQGEAAYPGQSPHGAYLKMYLNRKVLANPKNPPIGSVVVKENYLNDGKTLAAITVMYKAKGFDPENGDWYYVKYNPDGSVARTPPEQGSLKLAGKINSCIDCHAGAEGGDFLFFNDK